MNVDDVRVGQTVWVYRRDVRTGARRNDPILGAVLSQAKELSVVVKVLPEYVCEIQPCVLTAVESEVKWTPLCLLEVDG